MSDAATLHDRIIDDVERRILSGEWPPGRRIPFETDLADAYGCSRMTVNKALTRLAAAGLLERRRKSGTFVAAPRAGSAILDIPDIVDEITSRGEVHTHELLHRKITTDAGFPGEVLSLSCLHFSSERPFCHELRLICLSAVPGAQGADFALMPPGSWLLREVPWSTAEHVILSEPAGTSADLLGLSSGTPCLVVERRTWLGEEDITWARLVHPGDRHRLSARFTPRTSQ